MPAGCVSVQKNSQLSQGVRHCGPDPTGQPERRPALYPAGVMLPGLYGARTILCASNTPGGPDVPLGFEP